MFGKAFARAFRLRIEPHEVTPSEHAALAKADPPIEEPYLKAFLTWRRSVLFLVAVLLIPLTILRFSDANKLGAELSFLFIVPGVAEALLCIVCWFQLAHWTRWRKQRRALFRVWLVFMGAPFLVFLIPVEAMFSDADLAMAAAEEVAAVRAALAGFALLTLAPKAVSLLAGTIRAGLVTKMLFPGTAGPGWIVVFATPIYTLFVFTLLIVPYQATGSGWYFGAMIGLASAQLAIGRAGYRLAKPMTHDDAVSIVRKARTSYQVAMLVCAVCVVAALGSVVKQIGVVQIISFVLSFQTNVLLLTIIGSDLVITNLDRARGLTSGTTALVEETNRQINSFVRSTEAISVPAVPPDA